jgi:hypothetical protein
MLPYISTGTIKKIVLNSISYMNRDSVVHIATRLLARWSGSQIPPQERDFSLPPNVQRVSGAHPAYVMRRRSCFLGIKRPGREFYHPPQSSVEIKNECRSGWVVSTRCSPLYHREGDPVPILQDLTSASGPVWMGIANLTPTRTRLPEPLYRLSYPGKELI